MIDIGVNLTNARFNGMHHDVIHSADAAGVKSFIITGTNIEHSRLALGICKTFNQLYSTAGIHPHDASEFDQHSIDQLAELLVHDSVVAVGEMGLDFNRNFSTEKQQINAFEQQIELSKRIAKPMFLHERDAFDTQLSILKNSHTPSTQGVIHCFTGDKTALKCYLELGLYIGITGWICDERRGTQLRELVKYIPDDRLLIETDSPYLTPRTLTGKAKKSKNQPHNLPHIAEQIAYLRNQRVEHIKAITLANTFRLFSIDEFTNS